MTTFDLLALGTILFCIGLSAMRGLMGEVFSFVGWWRWRLRVFWR